VFFSNLLGGGNTESASMDEIETILAKYDEKYIRAGLAPGGDLRTFAATFYRDVAEIFDVITRARNTDRDPNGFTLDDAPILGLLVRTWKLLKEIVRYYEANNAEMISVLDRLCLEAVVTADYLLQSDIATVIDYRKCSYRHRLRMLNEARQGNPFYESKAGKRLLTSIRRKMRFESLTESDFEEQRKNRWRVGGKNFFDIFELVHSGDLYPMTYGIMSESIHGSWNDSLDFDLVQNEGGTFGAFPFFQPADPRFVGPLIRFAVPPFRAWLSRVKLNDGGLVPALDWIEKLNAEIFIRFDDEFDGP
jgi:hypothetical protein